MTQTAPASSVILELGLQITRVGAELHAEADVLPEMCVPGTDCLRLSVLAIWTDVLCGLLVGLEVQPRVPTTVTLSVDAHGAPAGLSRVHAVARLVKAGRGLLFAAVDWSTTDGRTTDARSVAVGSAVFALVPDTSLQLPDIERSIAAWGANSARLSEPLAERVQCVRDAPGVAVLPRTGTDLNAAQTMHGGLVALAAEEAALSLAPGHALTALALNYLRPARVGPAVASAQRTAELVRFEVHDEGSDHRLVVTGTAR
jgi:acyl-coenzyme A thioesterase PaaI-like protein